MKSLRDPLVTEWANRHAKLERDILTYVDALSDKGAARLAKVIGSFNTTNCWYAEYEIKPMIEGALQQRAFRIARSSTRSKNGP